MSGGLSVLATELLQYLLSSDEGYSDEQLKRHFGDRYTQLVPHVNELLMFNRLQLYNQGDSLYYKAIKEEAAAKFAGLGPEQILVYQAIERSGNKGIWTRDIKIGTNIAQNTLTKTLKILEQRNLIKSVRSVVSKSKKLYMVFDMVPAKEITGGPWYSDQEFDHDFVNALGEIIVNIVQKGNIVTLQDIAHKVRVSGVSKVDLSLEELELVVNTLIYDYRLEEVSTSGVSLAGQQGVGKRYKVTQSPAEENSVTNSYLTGIPCGSCPVLSQCSEHGVISPRTCEYYQQWLKDAVEMQDEEHQQQGATTAATTSAAATAAANYDW